MDEQLEVLERPPYIPSPAVFPNKNILNRLNIAIFMLLALSLAGCGGGANQSETATEDLEAVNAAYASDTYTCNYFIDAVAGVDTNSGSSPEDAWASANRATAHTQSSLARAGDTLCFKRGQRFVISDGRLGKSGSATAPIVIGAYGDPSEPAPRLSPAIRIDNSLEWVNLGNGVYYWPNSHPHWNVSDLWRAGIWQRPATDKSLSDGNWYYVKNDGVYLKVPSGQTFSGTIYLDTRYALYSVHGLQHIAFRDLIFEYAGAAISGRPVAADGSPQIIAYVSVRRCRFEHVATGIILFSESFNGVAYENHHIDIAGNQFDDIRHAIRLGARGNGPERHRYVSVAKNSIRNVTVNGRYVVHDKIPDIDAIGMQNTVDTRIVDNRIEQGLKLEQGLVNVDGDILVTNGIDLYRHPSVTLSRVRVERNYVRDLARCIVVGSGTEDGMRQVAVINNIASGCDIGLKANGTDTTRSYHVRFNTLFRNRINLFLGSAGSQIVVNNFSGEPREYHLVIGGVSNDSQIDYNAYVPDGRFLFQNTFDSTQDRELQNLRTFQAELSYGRTYDRNSVTASSTGFIKLAPSIPEDFRLTELSPGRARGVAIGLEDMDFGSRSRNRPENSGVDIGAWARHSTDG